MGLIDYLVIVVIDLLKCKCLEALSVLKSLLFLKQSSNKLRAVVFVGQPFCLHDSTSTIQKLDTLVLQFCPLDEVVK